MVAKDGDEIFNTLLDKIESGYELTKQEGVEEGERKKALEIAKELLDILSIEMIAKKTGLAITEVEALKNNS